MNANELIQFYEKQGKPIKLNLGCFNKPLPNFVNIDAREVSADLIEDCIELPSFQDNSVDLIYLSHVFEHFDFKEGKKAMKRYYDLLKEGGILRLAVPDMHAHFAHYFYWGDLKLLHSGLWGSQRHFLDLHKSGYDRKTLTELFLETGFTNVEEWKWQDVEHGFCDDYSQAYYPFQQKFGLDKGEDTKIGKLMSLNLQGIK